MLAGPVENLFCLKKRFCHLGNNGIHHSRKSGNITRVYSIQKQLCIKISNLKKLRRVAEPGQQCAITSIRSPADSSSTASMTFWHATGATDQKSLISVARHSSPKIAYSKPALSSHLRHPHSFQLKRQMPPFREILRGCSIR